MKHFEGKLTVKPYSVILEDENGSTFAGTLKLCPQEEGHQHALRLASCWNALEGMEPGELERFIASVQALLNDRTTECQYCEGEARETGRSIFSNAFVDACSQALRRLRKEGV